MDSTIEHLGKLVNENANLEYDNKKLRADNKRLQELLDDLRGDIDEMIQTLEKIGK